jgi:hypothetical protein
VQVVVYKTWEYETQSWTAFPQEAPLRGSSRDQDGASWLAFELLKAACGELWRGLRLGMALWLPRKTLATPLNDANGKLLVC